MMMSLMISLMMMSLRMMNIHKHSKFKSCIQHFISHNLQYVIFDCILWKKEFFIFFSYILPSNDICYKWLSNIFAIFGLFGCFWEFDPIFFISQIFVFQFYFFFLFHVFLKLIWNIVLLIQFIWLWFVYLIYHLKLKSIHFLIWYEFIFTLFFCLFFFFFFSCVSMSFDCTLMWINRLWIIVCLNSLYSFWNISFDGVFN